MTVQRNENFKQVCVWQGCVVGNEKIAEFESFMKENFKCRAQYLEEIVTLPGDDGEGERNDLFFAIHDEDIAAFAVARLDVGIRWVEDVLAPCNYHDPIYPEYVFEYKTW